MAISTNVLHRIVDDIRERWRRRAIIRGLALTGVVALVLAFIFLLAVTNVVIAKGAFAIALIVALGIVAAVAWQYVARPLRNQPSDEQIALFVEEQIPDLEDRFNAAIEVDSQQRGGASTTREGLIQQLMQDAAARTKRIRPDTLIDRRREQWLAYGAGALLVVFLLFGYSVRDKINFNEGRVQLVGLSMAQPAISITPGSVEIEKGASQEIIARLRDDSDEDVVLVWKEGDADWRRDVMLRGAVDDPAFLFELENLQEETQYFIEQGDLRSEPFTLTLYEFPSVSEISVRVAHPSYTGLPATVDEDTGDISALKGSRATINILAGGTTNKAEIVFADGRTQDFAAGSNGSFTATLPIAENDYYTIRLTDERDKHNKFPEEWRIEALDDLEPVVTITEPKRDLRANAIEEVLVAAEASDDIGLKSLSIVYSVNASEEKSVPLAEGLTRSTRQADGSHLFFLEDYSLSAGDVISYYVQVEDHLERSVPIATDMYFIEVIPFDNKYTQANNAGGGGGGGGEQSGIVISQQQIIAATWKLIREQQGMTEGERDGALKALISAQANLKQNIEQRISSTAFSLELRASEEQQQIVEHLRNSISEMDRAIDVLESTDLKGALTPERMALNHLLRADAMNREQQVQANRGQGGGGGGGGGAQDRITELMDLELDISKDKYETQQQRQQNSGGNQDQAIDEALNKVRELARKQEELADRGRENNIEGEDKKRFIETLKRDQDEIKEQTEQLSNALSRMSGEQGNGKEMQRQMDRVTENMEKSERALRRGDVEEAMTHQQRALNELEELQDQLTRRSTDDAREKVRQLADQFDQFRAQEKRLAEDIDKAAEDARARGQDGRQAGDRQTTADLREKRDQMIENLDKLQERAESVEKSIRDDDPALANAIRNMLQQIRRDGLERNMQDSREGLRQNWLDYADRKEDMIMETVDQLDEQRRAFDGTLPVSDEEKLARSMQDLRDLRSQLEDIQREAQNARGETQGQAGSGEGEGNAESQSQGEGQGEAAGEAGQNGEGRGGQGQGGGENQGQNAERDARAAQARLERQIERARQTLDRLEENTGNNPEGRRQIGELRNFLNRADGTGVKLEGKAAEDFFNARAYNPLSQLEEVIVRQLDYAQLEKKLHGAKRSQVPAEYQELVDKYYESLSKENQ